jgi:hypothetical protein
MIIRAVEINTCIFGDNQFIKSLKIQDVMGRPKSLLSLIKHGPNIKTRDQQFFYCCKRIRCRGNTFTEPLPSNDNGIHT